MCRAHETSSISKICLDTVGTATNGQCVVSRPVLIPIVERYNTYPTAYANKAIYNNLPMCANILAEGRDYLHKHINLPNILPSTINGEMQCDCVQRSLEENLHYLNK